MKKDQIKAFAKDYAKEADVKFVSKKKLTALIRWALRKAKGKFAKTLPELAEELRPMVVRIWRRTYVLLPDSPGCGSLPLATQLGIMVHEVAHALRIDLWVERGGTVAGWYEEYFKNPSFRAIEEGLACAAEAEIRYALFDMVPKPPKLDSYCLLSNHIADAHVAYQSNIDEVKKLGRGASTFDASTIAIRLMRKHGIL